ncbi:hypothetical protein D3C79_831380 [compost metagenome]
MLEADKALLIDVLQTAIPEAQGAAVGVEAVVATGKVEGIAVGLALRQVAEHGDQFFIARLVAQAGGAQVPRLQGQPADFRRADAGALIGRRQ